VLLPGERTAEAGPDHQPGRRPPDDCQPGGRVVRLLGSDIAHAGTACTAQELLLRRGGRSSSAKAAATAAAKNAVGRAGGKPQPRRNSI